MNHDGKIVLLAFGDSITRGMGDGPQPGHTPPGTGGYPLRLEKLLGVKVMNDGSSGERTTEGLPRLQRDVADTHPDYAILLEGTNDLLGGESSSRAVDNMRSMVHSVRAAGVVPILGTITPFCCDIEKRHPRSATLAYNDALRALAASEGVKLVDFYAAYAGGPRRCIRCEQGPDTLARGASPHRCGLRCHGGGCAPCVLAPLTQRENKPGIETRRRRRG